MTPLELAVLHHDRAITKYLLQNGGTESDECEMILKRLKDEVRNNLIEATKGDEKPKQDTEVAVWERRRKSIRRLILGWDQLKRPDKPKLLVEPISPDSVMVALSIKDCSAIITKIKGI